MVLAVESMGFLVRLYRVVALQNEEVFPGLDFWVTQPFPGYQLLHLQVHVHTVGEFHKQATTDLPSFLAT